MRGLPDLSAIREARALLAKHFAATPLTKAPSLSTPDAEVYLKVETGLPTGSSKPRGDLRAAKNLERGTVEEAVVASSTAIDGAATAFAASAHWEPRDHFLPEGANPVKRTALKISALVPYATEAPIWPALFSWRKNIRPPATVSISSTKPPILIRRLDLQRIGLELLEQSPTLTAVDVPMGDTASIRGVGAAVKALAPQYNCRCSGGAVRPMRCHGVPESPCRSIPANLRRRPGHRHAEAENHRRHSNSARWRGPGERGAGRRWIRQRDRASRPCSAQLARLTLTAAG